MFRKNIIYVVVILIGALLLSDILLTHYNNNTMKKNRDVRSEITRIKLYYDQIGKVVIHSLDIGLRGYALIPERSFAQPMLNSLAWKDSIFQQIETPLKKFNYDLTLYREFKDSVNSYTKYCFLLKDLLDAGDTTKFKSLFRSDKGAQLWNQYINCERDVVSYLNAVDQKAITEIETAMARNQALQILLFLLCFPTLLYTAFHTGRTFRLSELLRLAEEERNKFLVGQNSLLERSVAERTQEILAQNEEIMSQTEELATQRDTLFLQNKKVQEAHKVIEIQNQEIQFKNESLQREIVMQTQELRNANQELIAHNNQLEQFAFIAAHNLRAPLARILGLANIIKISDEEKDRNDAMGKIVSSTHDLDAVVKDLTTILDIKKHTSNFTAVDLSAALQRVLKTLEKECEETNAQINIDITSLPVLYAVSPYLESIFYNLISNAIKYRNPEKRPIITIRLIDHFDHTLIIFSDNGLGIDLDKHGKTIFNLYKRFHLHVEGKGLGLFLVKAQMVAMGGKVEVESEPGKGTAFKLHFKK
ncbi:MAG: HAMP domain-containing sensor histidine kinase [Chryseolinea sp.]